MYVNVSVLLCVCVLVGVLVPLDVGVYVVITVDILVGDIVPLSVDVYVIISRGVTCCQCSGFCISLCCCACW